MASMNCWKPPSWAGLSVQDRLSALSIAADLGTSGAWNQLHSVTSGKGIDTSAQAAPNPFDQQGQEQILGSAPERGVAGAETAIPGGGGAAARVGVGAAMAGQALAENNLQDPDQRQAGLAWAGLAGLMAFGHLPPGTSKALQKVFARWPELETAAQRALHGIKASGQGASGKNPQKVVTDYIKHYLEQGGEAGSERTLARARKPGEFPLSVMEQRPGGELMLKAGQQGQGAEARAQDGPRFVG
jgi:hypothetical protein